MEKFIILSARMSKQQAMELFNELTNDCIGFLIISGVRLPIPMSLRQFASHCKQYQDNVRNPSPYQMVLFVNGLYLTLNHNQYVAVKEVEIEVSVNKSFNQQMQWN
jgi:hypothetical protein